MIIPFKIKKLTSTAKVPTQENAGDLWDLYADGFCAESLKDIDQPEAMYNYHIIHGKDHTKCYDRNNLLYGDGCIIYPKGRILVKTGIAIELPFQSLTSEGWNFGDGYLVRNYAVADIRPRSGLALKHGITVLNTPGTIDNSYRKEIGIILINHGHEPYMINKGDKIAQMLIRTLAPSQMEVVDFVEDTGRGGFGSTGK